MRTPDEINSETIQAFTLSWPGPFEQPPRLQKVES
jgi:hypothetical protein